ncbi:short-chain dehydrogenase [Psychromonas sp. CNPT3]|uniref:SDR family NAD(P)-dependent oxidoreductase n=1 Tax=Psychromonas sp. CNPT3 TaxID=314282 RepID=UPI00006E80C0|nr:SDR family oxidoreductase [Psychromonas sp. CNPT3]AGH80810.1 short-chain dehydrogenase [Psychromonas sp. CNPT3]
MGKVVVITGASSGLGEEFAYQLAEQGASLLLIARRSSKLQSIAQQIMTKYAHVKVYVLVLDLSVDDASEHVLNYIETHQLSLQGLINNAGFGARGYFESLELTLQQQMLQVNIHILMSLTHCLIAQLKSQENAFIINVASTAAFQAGPNLAVYYASKAFVLSFSQALYEELKGDIKISALCPGATRTEFADIAGMSDLLLFKLRVMKKEDVVRYALKYRHKAIVIPGLMNKIGASLAQILPASWVRKIAFQIQK